MKFGTSVADIFTIKHAQFGWDAFGFGISIVHCLELQFFFVDTVYKRNSRYEQIPHIFFRLQCAILL